MRWSSIGAGWSKIPAGFTLMAPGRLWPLITTSILSPWGKLRLLGEYFVPRRTADGDESLGAFARRRLGREAFERIVQPLVGGIYTADPERLSLRATLPRFLDMERRHGSLIRAARAERAAANPAASDNGSGARYGLFVTPRDGLTSLVEAIAARLPPGAVRLNCPVDSVVRAPSGSWTVRLAAACASPTELECDGLILAVGAPAASRLLASVDRPLAGDLGRIPYAGTSIVTLAFRREQIARQLDGFGFVVPAIEKRRILAGSFSNIKFPGRAPHDTVLVRVFIGGAMQSELADLPDDALRAVPRTNCGSLLGVIGLPLFDDIARWPQSMPQYHVGHGQLVAEIERAATHWPGLALAGNAYHGVGIPNCIHSGQRAAEQINAGLQAI